MAFTLIMVAGGLLFKLADLIIEKGVAPGVAARLFVYELPSVVVLTLPMSCLLAALLGFSTMSANSEIVALKAAGVSFSRISRPVLLAAAVVSVFAMLLNESVVPKGKAAAMNVMRYEVAREKPAFLKEQIFLRSNDAAGKGTQRIIYINKLYARTGEMEDVVVQEFESSALVRFTTAKRGKWGAGRWVLYDGNVFEVRDGDMSVDLALHFQQQVLPVSLTPQQLERSSSKPDDLSCMELLKQIEIMKLQGQSTEPLWVAFHLRFAVPWACVILALIGASLGVRHMRKGGTGVGFGQSILIVFVYYVFMSMGRSLGQSGRIPPLLGAWLPNFIFFAGAMFLARRADG